MDHKVSKDMISSGMIPSGEKTQADLGRTQYGSAPSPSKLMDAYKSMYEKKEETLNERLGLMKAAKLAVKYPKIAASNIGNPRKPHIDNIKRARAKGFFKGIKGGEAQATAELRKAGDSETLKADKRAKVSQIMAANNENVDLLASYHAVYEHHKKDADGNTIPHEGEELDEAIVSVPLALATKAIASKLAVKGAALGAKAAATKALATKGAAAVGSKVGAAALKTATKAGTMAGKLKSAGGIKGVATKGMRSAGKAIKDNPVNTALVGTMAVPSGGGSMPQKTGGPVIGQYNDVDLFDLVKGQLLDEGIDEKDALKIMVELSQEDLNIIVNEGIVGNIARLTAAGTVATMGANAIRQQLQNKEKMDKGGKFKKGGMMDNIQKKNQMLKQM